MSIQRVQNGYKDTRIQGYKNLFVFSCVQLHIYKTYGTQYYNTQIMK